MAETPLPELDIYFIAQGLTSAAWEALAPRVAERSETAGLDPNELRTRPRPYELLMNGAQRAEIDKDMAGLTTRFAGGTVEISDEAMAQTGASAGAESPAAPETAAEPATDETTETDSAENETETDSSPSGGTMTPDLGERVL